MSRSDSPPGSASAWVTATASRPHPRPLGCGGVARASGRESAQSFTRANVIAACYATDLKPSICRNDRLMRFQLAKVRLTTEVVLSAHILRRAVFRLHNVSRRDGSGLQKPGRILDRRRAEMHVPLSGAQIPVTCEFLNRTSGRSRIAKCEQNVCLRICGPLLLRPALRAARPTASRTALSVSGFPVSRFRTNGPFKCRWARSASANRVVIGTYRSRPSSVLDTCPCQSLRSTQIWRLS